MSKIIGYIVKGNVLCDLCTADRRVPLYDVNVHPYRQTCYSCGLTLHAGQSPAWPELYGSTIRDTRGPVKDWGPVARGTFVLTATLLNARDAADAASDTYFGDPNNAHLDEVDRAFDEEHKVWTAMDAPVQCTERTAGCETCYHEACEADHAAAIAAGLALAPV